MINETAVMYQTIVIYDVLRAQYTPPSNHNLQELFHAVPAVNVHSLCILPVAKGKNVLDV